MSGEPRLAGFGAGNVTNGIASDGQPKGGGGTRAGRETVEGIGNLNHLAFTVARATDTQIARRLTERNINHTGEVDWVT